MHIVNVIGEYIENSDTSSFLSFISEYISSNKVKRDFVDALIYIFAQHYVDNNLWVVEKLHGIFVNIENCTVKQMGEINSHLLTCFNILCTMKKRHYQFDLNPTAPEDHKSLLYAFDKEYENLAFAKDILNDTPYSLLNIFQSKLIDGNFRDIAFICRVFIGMKKRELLKKGANENIDAVDLIILCIKSMSNYMKNEILLFMDMCKDIMYYNASKKKKIDRINILLICLYVICKGSVKYQQLMDVSKRECLQPTKYDALFIVFNYDYGLMAEVESMKNQRRPFSEKKVINIMNCNLINDGVPKNDVNIIKT